MGRAVCCRTAHHRGVFAAALIGAMVTCLPMLCRAQTTITVNSANDPADTGKCTLRDAINVALGNPISPDMCTRSGSGAPYTIVFDAALTGDTIILTDTLPAITSGTRLTIIGPGSAPGIAISGNHSVRLMQVQAGARLNLQYLTLENGGVTGASGSSAHGGAILNDGRLAISNSTLSDNRVTGGTGSAVGGFGQGGAIYNDGRLNITDSTLADNQAVGGDTTNTGGSGEGGAIFNAGRLNVINSTFADNQVSGGDGTDSGGGAFGGAIDNASLLMRLTFTNCTFSGNQATAGSPGGNANGGAISGGGSRTRLKGTILAANTPANCDNPAPADEGYNLADDASCSFASGGTSMVVAPSAVGLAAGLADNGGPTQTIALLMGSPAIDAIPRHACTYPLGAPDPCAAFGPGRRLTCDQRGEPRPDPGDHPPACDIGAYELQDAIGFARFKVRAAIRLPDDFLMWGDFRLGRDSGGIDPVNDAVTLTIGPATLTLPPGSFQEFFRSFRFAGMVGSVRVYAVIIPSGSPRSGRNHTQRNYRFEIRGDGLNLNSLTNPVTVGLQIGSEAGSASINAYIR